MEFCDKSWNFTNFAPAFYQMCAFLAKIKRFVISLESPHFMQSLSREMVMENRETVWRSHGKVMENLFTKSVGTLM